MDFDGIDEVVLPAPDASPLVEFYTQVMEFTVISTEDSPDPQLADVWSLPAPPSRTTLLGKPGSAGGWIRVVEVPGLPEPVSAGRPDRSGAFALDFYLRDPVATEAVIAQRYRFRAPPAWYPLPGHPDTMVHEGILDQTHSGIIHATVGYRPRGTRCVLDQDESATISEVVAVVVSSHRYDEAVAFVEEVLGGRPYLSGEFGGDQIERLLLLDQGEMLPMTLFRGPASRNARLEICRAREPKPPRPDEAVPRVTATIRLADLDAVATRIASGEHGPSTGVREVRQDGRTTRRVGIRTIHGLSLDLVERSGP